MTPTGDEHFRLEQGVFVPTSQSSQPRPAYDESNFDLLLRMQREHFWYRGRHKLILNALRREVSRRYPKATGLQAIDMGGGCGGWIEFLHAQDPALFSRLALGDGWVRALRLAEPVVGAFAARYEIDLCDLPWLEEWDVVFLLDVLEHIPDHVEVLRQVRRSLRPGGLVFVTTPALQLFWTYNDALAGHQRRYCRKDFVELGRQAGLTLLRTDYFMFFLSPLLLSSRLLFRPPASATPDDLKRFVERSHRVPARPINAALEWLFSLEAAAVNRVRFPWGTSILAVFGRDSLSAS